MREEMRVHECFFFLFLRFSMNVLSMRRMQRCKIPDLQAGPGAEFTLLAAWRTGRAHESAFLL